MSPRIAVTGRIPSAGLDLLHEAGEVVAWDSLDVPSVEQVHDMVRGADAVLTLLTTKVDAAFLDAAGPRLKVVANVAVGYNNIDVAACVERGVVCTNTPGVLTEDTADMTMAMLLGSGACSTCSVQASRATSWASSAWATSARRSHGGPRRSA